MEMYAVIKRGKETEVVNGAVVQKKVNSDVKNIINDFLDNLFLNYGENHIVTLSDLNRLFDDDSLLGDYVYNNILNNLILQKQDNGINKMLNDLFDGYELDEELVSYIVKNHDFKKYFNVNKYGSISYNKGLVSKTLKDAFGYFIGNDLFNKMQSLLSSFDYDFGYSVSEMEDYVSSNDDLVKLNRKNFELFLYNYGIISNPDVQPFLRHRCYRCSNLSPLLCEKAEYYKKNISEYSFIKNGYQIYIVSGYQKDLVSFIVEDCNDYIVTNDKDEIQTDYSYVRKLNRKG